MSGLREALADAIGASEFHDLLPRGCIFHHNDAAEAAERMFRDYWNTHREDRIASLARLEFGPLGATSPLGSPMARVIVDHLGDVLFGAPLDQEQP